MRIRDLSRTLIATATVVALVAGCRAHDRAPHTSAGLTPVRIEMLPYLSFAPLAIANDEGFFREEGIAPEMVNIGIREGMIALAAGRLDVIAGPIRSGLFSTIGRGQSMQIVADKGHIGTGCDSDAILARTDVADRLARTGDYRSLRVATSKASTIEYLLDRFIATRHIDRNSLVLRQTVGAESLSLVRSGALDLHFGSEPGLSSATSSGIARILASAKELAPGLQMSVLIYGRHLLKDDPDLGRRFMRAYLRGVRQYNEGKTDRNVAIIARLTHLSPAEVRRACWAPMTSDGSVNVASVNQFIEWSRERQYLAADVRVDGWWNPTFAQAASRSLDRSPLHAE